MDDLPHTNPIDRLCGAGSGLDSEGVRHKYNVLKRSLENYKGDGSALDVMRYFGGYEMVMAVGACCVPPN